IFVRIEFLCYTGQNFVIRGNCPEYGEKSGENFGIRQTVRNMTRKADRILVSGKLSGIWRENRTEFWYSANCPEYDEKSGQNFGIRETVRNLVRKPDRILVSGKLSGIW